jgi:hypothetical protein
VKLHRVLRFHQLYKRLPPIDQAKVILLIALALTRLLKPLRQITVYWIHFPIGLAVIHALIAFAMLVILPPIQETPVVLLAINYVLSFYIAAWLWFLLRKFKSRTLRYA